LTPTDLRAHYFGLGGTEPGVGDRVTRTRPHPSDNQLRWWCAQLDFGLAHGEVQAVPIPTRRKIHAVRCSSTAATSPTYQLTPSVPIFHNAGESGERCFWASATRWLVTTSAKMLTSRQSAACNQLPNPDAYHKAALCATMVALRRGGRTVIRKCRNQQFDYGDYAFINAGLTKPWSVHPILRYARPEPNRRPSRCYCRHYGESAGHQQRDTHHHGPLSPVRAKPYLRLAAVGHFKIVG